MRKNLAAAAAARINAAKLAPLLSTMRRAYSHAQACADPLDDDTLTRQHAVEMAWLVAAENGLDVSVDAVDAYLCEKGV